MWKEDPTGQMVIYKYQEQQTGFWKEFFRGIRGEPNNNNPIKEDCFFICSAGFVTYQSGEVVEELKRKAKESPVSVMTKREWSWWMYQGHFFKENEARKYTREEAKAVILQKLRKKERSLEWAIAQMNEETGSDSDGPGRLAIPEEIKLTVWRRDRGKCVQCGSNKSLEFDHIIPISRGGSSTERNVQLLCEHCNRSKGGNLV